jgi:hypothetical protein
VTPTQSSPEFADFIQSIANRYPAAQTIHLVMDNLSSHTKKSLTDRFGKEEGEALWDRFTGAGWTLTDGVDLNLLTPKRTIDRADDVSRIFWHYSRLSEEGQTGQIRKIGTVPNGISHLKPLEHDAHDYALHRLQSEADTTIETASTEATAKLVRELQATR